ncbi:MAG: glutathione S-transferase family protein [Enhygromyxa sp.]
MSRLSPANASLEAPERAATSKPEGAEVLRLPSAELSLEAEAETAPAPAPAPKITLYHFPTSLYSQQVRLALAEKRVVWESKIVNIGPAHEHFAPWYAKINPRLEVPTLEVDGTIVTEASSIVAYLDEHLDGPALMPSDPEARAEALAWIERATELPMRELGYARTKGITRWLQRWSLKQRRKQLIKLRKRNPELDDVYAAKLDDLQALEQAINDRRATSELVDRVELELDELETTLGDRQWLAGDDYSLADLLWTAVLARLEHIGFARSISQHRRPAVQQWYRRLRERPSWPAMIRRLTLGQITRFYGPAALKAFLVFWVLKWTLVGGGLWLIKHLLTG